MSKRTKNKKWTKFVFFSDNHGDLENTAVSDAFANFLIQFKPDVKIHGGDCFDMVALRKGAAGRDEYMSLEDDLDSGLKFISRFKPDVFLMGNHEDRLYKMRSSAGNGIVRDYCDNTIKLIVNELKSNGCKVIKEYHAEGGVYRLGPIAFVHGYTANTRSVEEHAIHYAPVGGACVIGHLHSIQQVNAKKHGGAVGFCGGCFCQKDKMTYSKNNLGTSKWGNGWIYGWVKGKDWKILQAHKVGGHWLAPTDLKLT